MPKITRRQAIGVMAASPVPVAFAAQSATGNNGGNPTVRWLGGSAPSLASGVSFGVPWPKGAVKTTDKFSLTTADGKTLPVQSWQCATWPDGSVKWTGFATIAGPEAVGEFRLVPATATVDPATPVRVSQDADAIEIDNGRLKCRIGRHGAALIQSMSIDGREVAANGRLLCTLEDRSQLESARTARYEDFHSDIKKVTLEQSGPVRGVVKVEGVHKTVKGSREWLPFVVRLYFYAGQEAVKTIHTIVFDGDDHKDFISALGMVFDVPMREQVHNRHARFTGEGDGVWAEAIEPVTGRRPLIVNGENALVLQVAGKRLPNKEQLGEREQTLLNDWAVWSDFRLVQANADGFTVHKRTNPQSCWLECGAGKRASGMAFVGDVSGGLGMAVKNFWQSYPASLEIHGAASEKAQLHAWLWSPDAPAMDLRHYDTRAHGLDSSYEDVQPGFSTAHGVARTSELMLYPSAVLPTTEDTAKQAHLAAQPPLLVCSPQHLHSAQVFGVWNLPDRSAPAKAWVEDQIDAAIAFYQKEVEQRHWYGFWNFGDIMHSYDTPRHVWRYDVGGMAWDNSELVPDMWLWCSFLRTGRADVFRMAEAMTRHTGEVDTYHLGRFAHLGSRHNVRHWGCGAKEARISQAALRRFYYYLTTDERTGDVMHEQADADLKLLEIDPMRLASPIVGPAKYPARIRGGPDWLAFVGNWMTEWERTGNAKYRDKILAGVQSFAAMPYGFLSGPNSLFGYDPATNKLYTLEADPFGSYNLQVIMGGAEVAMELDDLLQNQDWSTLWLQYCRLVGARRDVVKRDMVTHSEDSGPVRGGAGSNGRLAAYAYFRTKDAKYAQRAWTALLRNPDRRPGAAMFATRPVKGPDVLNDIEEVPMLSTNSTAQWCLNAIEVLALAGDHAPADFNPAGA